MDTLSVTIGVCGATPFDEARSAILTTDHAASSYGLPVLVIDGIAHGPAEVNETLHPQYPHLPRPGGERPEYETDDELRARRDPAGLALADAARRAGYRVA